MQNVPDIGEIASRAVLTTDVPKVNLILQQVKNTHSCLWFLRYLACSFQHGIDNLKKRITESIIKWQNLAGKANELNYWVVAEGPSDEHYKSWLEEKLALIAKMDIQVEKKKASVWARV